MNARGLLRQLWASGPGRAGLILVAILLVTATYVVLRYPFDYGPARWSDPLAWADNPKAAPPEWTDLLGPRRAIHRVLSATEPAETRTAGPATIRTYRMPIDFQEDEAPTFLSFDIGQLTYHARPPSYSVVLVRPDGQEVTLYRDVERGPRPGEQAPYVRNIDAPERVLLSSEDSTNEATIKLWQDVFGVTVTPQQIAGHPERYLFGTPDASGGVTPLHGDYALQLRMAVADPTDEISRVGAVVGGSVYGLLGTDTQGRDLAEGLLFGLPIALMIGILAAIVSTAIGTGLGLLSGYKGGRTDLVIQRSADIVNNVPLLPLLIFMVFILGSQLWLIMLVLVAFSWPGLTITVRSMVLGLGGSQEVEAARALGAPTRHVVYRHILPHTLPYVVTQLIFFVPAAILAEAGLSFLGLGDPTLPTWGQVLEQGYSTGAVYLGYWWWVVPPGLLIILTAVTFMLLAIALEPIVQPRLRRGA
jgi:peptide/nickel transport system permease protein